MGLQFYHFMSHPESYIMAAVALERAKARSSATAATP